MTTKEEMLCALASADIEVPPTATLMQLRKLYQKCVPETGAVEQPSKSESISQTTCRRDDAVVKDNREYEEAAANSMEDARAPSENGDRCNAEFRRWELFVLQERIREMKHRQAIPEGRLVHPEELKHLIPEFSDGLGINRWIETIRYNSEIYEWQDRTMLLYAGSRLAGAAREWYNGFHNTLLTFDELAREIKKAFPDRCNEAVIHSQLAAVYKQSTESYAGYVYRVNALGKSGNVSEEAIITYAIRGLSRDPLYDCLITKEYNDIYDLVRNIKRCETHFLMRRKPESRIPSFHNTNALRMNAPQQTVAELSRCYNCSDFGHYSSQCTKPRRAPGSCFQCGSTSHVYRNCPKSVRRQPTVAAVQGEENEVTSIDVEEDGNILKLDAYQELEKLRQ